MYGFNVTNKIDLKAVIQAIQDSFDDSLLKPAYLNVKQKNKFTGHCYAGSEALYYLTGGKDAWVPHVARDHNGDTHWWLKNKLTNEIVDVTARQYTDFDEQPPYHKGCGRGFQQQSHRCVEIMKRVSERLDLGLFQP